MKSLTDSMGRIKRTCIAVLIILGVSLPCLIDGTTISRKEQDEIIRRICSLLRSNYVSAQIGERVGESLMASYGEAKYSDTKSMKGIFFTSVETEHGTG
jgi:hypothetical protein